MPNGRLYPPEVRRQVGRCKCRQGKPCKSDDGVALRTLVIDEVGRLARIEPVLGLTVIRERVRQKREQHPPGPCGASQRAGGRMVRGGGVSYIDPS